MSKETDEEVAVLASSYIKYIPSIFAEEFGSAFAEGRIKEFVQDLTADIRTLAASCLSQAEPDADDNS